jgi:cell division protein FtsB
MSRLKRVVQRAALVYVIGLALAGATSAQDVAQSSSEEFGPVVQAYLGYLRDEQEVVDDRASRREISKQYYRRNSNRIRALRQMAISIARETGNDYLPELEARTRDELATLFENPPNPRTFRVDQVLADTFRYLGVVRAGESFYLFARLDPYEQAERIEKNKAAKDSDGQHTVSPVSTSAEPGQSRHRVVPSPPR